MTSVAVSALANVVGLAAAALALILLSRSGEGWWARRPSRREIGLLSIFLAGCLLVVGGQYTIARKLLEPAALAGTQARMQVALGEPIDALSVRIAEPDPFRALPDAYSLRLIATTRSGQELISRLPRGRMDLRAGGPALKDAPGNFREYTVSWRSVVEGAASEEGRALASRIVTLNDWRRFDRVEAEIVSREAPGDPMPGSVRIATVADPPVELFNGRRVRDEAERRGDEWACTYRDPPWITPTVRLTGWMAEMAAMPRGVGLDATVIGLLGAGLALLAAGIGLLDPGTASLTRVPAWAAPAIVWGVWALMLAASLAFVAKYAHNIPFGDDWWLIVPFVVGEKPISLGVLWEQEFEHRYPLTRLVALNLVKFTGDFRAPTVFVTLALAGLSFAMIRVAREMRGRTSVTDAFFPLALLMWGFPTLLVWGWGHLAYLVPTLVATPLLLIAARRGTRLTPGTAMLAGACLALLPLSSAAGMVYLPLISIWLAYSALLSWRSPGPSGKASGAIILCWLMAAALISLLYFRGFDRTGARVYSPPSPGAAEAFVNGLAVASSSFGEAARRTWPLSGLAMLLLIALSAGSLIVVAWRDEQGPDRPRALALLCFLGASGMLALALGWGRPDHTFDYPTLIFPLLCCIYFSWLLHGSGRAGRLARTALVACMGLAVLINMPGRLRAARERHAARDAFEKDLRRGMPPYRLAYRHLNAHGISEVRELKRHLEELRRAGFGPFRYLKDDPAFQVVTIPLEPSETGGVRWENGVASGASGDSHLTFSLPHAMYVAAIRLRCSTPQGGPVTFNVGWKNPLDAHFYEPFYYNPWWPTRSDVVPVDDTIDRIRIFPDRNPGSRPFEFRLAEIEVLVPEGREARGGRPVGGRVPPADGPADAMRR
jgi:hypothetical protein